MCVEQKTGRKEERKRGIEEARKRDREDETMRGREEETKTGRLIYLIPLFLPSKRGKNEEHSCTSSGFPPLPTMFIFFSPPVFPFQ